jgi:hypothetical protein
VVFRRDARGGARKDSYSVALLERLFNQRSSGAPSPAENKQIHGEAEESRRTSNGVKILKSSDAALRTHSNAFEYLLVTIDFVLLLWYLHEVPRGIGPVCLCGEQAKDLSAAKGSTMRSVT